MIRHSYSEKQLAVLMGCTVRTVQRWKKQHGLGRKVWLADLRRCFPAAYESAQLLAAYRAEHGGDSSE